MIRSAGGGAVRGSRRPLRGLLTMRLFLNAIKDLPHPEEHGRAITRPCVSKDAGCRCSARRYSAATGPNTGPPGMMRRPGRRRRNGRARLSSTTGPGATTRSEEHTSELQSLMRISYAIFCTKKNKKYIYL